MSYEINDIKLSQEVFYYLLEHKQLGLSDDEKLYRDLIDNDNARVLLKHQADAANITIAQYGRTVYLIPEEDNNFLGFTKRELKLSLCKSGALEKDYYLAMFAIVVLLMEFYDGQAGSAKTRDYIKIGDLQNSIGNYLRAGAAQYNEEEQSRNGVLFSEMLESYSALKSDEKLNRRKTTKEGFLYNIMMFLQEQNLVHYIEQDEMIRTTEKLDVFMDFNILSQSNYRRVLAVMSGIGDNEDEQN